MRYIDADKAKAKLIEWLDSTGALPKGTSYYHECLSCIDDTPTESVVGAVRCKDCVAGEKTGDDSITFAIKDRNGNYYTGYNTWSNQLRKAKLYNSYKWAKEIRDDVRFIERDTFIVKVRTTELDECFYED